MFLKLVDVKKSFGKKESKIDVLKGISLDIEEGEMVAIMGKSGSGKSTLLNVIAGMCSLDSGELWYKDSRVDVTDSKGLRNLRNKYVGFVVQYFALIEDMTVYENIALPLRYKRVARKEIKSKVNEIAEQMGISDKLKAYPEQLSGGQQQRVAIARAIVKDSDLILADEPTGALDENTGEDVLKIFKKLNEMGKTIIIVTHDAKVADNCGRIIYIKDGEIIS